MQFTAQRMEAATRPGEVPKITEPRAPQDALQAMRLIRRDAEKWGVDPQRVGIIGFSAGAMTSLLSVMDGQAPDWPAFVGYIYGPMTAVEVPENAPPLFVALALDDMLFARQGFGIVESWREAGRPVELHAYEKGNHGFGTGYPGSTTALVLDEFMAWMGMHGMLGGAGDAAGR